MQALFFLKQCLVKLFNLRHIHIDTKQAFDFTFFIQYPVSEGADMANTVFHGNAKFQFKGRARLQ